MRRWKLTTLLRAATAYEDWAVPIEAGLRLSTMLSAVGAGLGLALAAGAELLRGALASPFWLVLPSEAIGAVELLATVRHELTLFYALWLVAIGLLGLQIAGYRRANLGWHRVLFWLGLAGAGNACVLGLGLALVLLNGLLWLALCALALLCITLIALGGRRGS